MMRPGRRMLTAGPATGFQKLTPVALKFSPIFFQFLAISADFASFVAKLLPVAGNFVTRRVSAQIPAQLSFCLKIVLAVFLEILSIVLNFSSILSQFTPSRLSPPAPPPIVVVGAV